MAKKTKTRNNFDIKQLVGNSNSLKSVIYGAVTVLIVAIIVFLGVRALSQNQGDINEEAVVDESSDYEVVEGDTLWSISEKVYGTGFDWKIIADANNIENPSALEAGTKLNIPDLTEEENEDSEEVESPTAEETVDSQEADTTSKEYVVVAGDNLWKIAVAQYNDGYKWVEIAEANNLVNPGIIHAGNRLVIPR